jgi:AcrR family transcriptional regulator
VAEGRPAPPANAPRAEQVRETRARVLAAAHALFVRRGYPGTTVDAIANRAGVSVQTVDNVIGGKAAVLKAVYDVALAGDDEPVPMAGRPHVVAIRQAPDAAAAMRVYARFGRLVHERTGPLVTPVFVEGKGQDAQVRAFAEAIEKERAAGTAVLAAELAGRFPLRDGLSVAEAGQVLWTLTAPETADRLVRRCGWSLDRYERWIAETMTEALFRER